MLPDFLPQVACIVRLFSGWPAPAAGVECFLRRVHEKADTLGNKFPATLIESVDPGIVLSEPRVRVFRTYSDYFNELIER